MNKFFLIGNLTHDPELMSTANGVSKCRFSIASNRPYAEEGEKKADFFTLTAWRGVAENIAKYCKKGDKLFIAARVEENRYKDEAGNEHFGYDFTVNEAEFLSSLKKKEGVAE